MKHVVKKIFYIVAILMLVVSNIKIVSAASYWEQFYITFHELMYADPDALDFENITLNEPSGNSFSIVTHDNNTNLDYTVEFTYDNGVVSYVKDESLPENFFNSFVQNTWVNYAVEAVAKIKGYNTNHFKEWFSLQNFDDASITTDGYELKMRTVTATSNGEDINFEIIDSFKIDICNGFKLYDPNINLNVDPTNPEPNPDDNKTPEEDNPNTGIFIGYGAFVCILLVSGIIYGTVRKQNKFPLD